MGSGYFPLFTCASSAPAFFCNLAYLLNRATNRTNTRSALPKSLFSYQYQPRFLYSSLPTLHQSNMDFIRQLAALNSLPATLIDEEYDQRYRWYHNTYAQSPLEWVQYRAEYDLWEKYCRSLCDNSTQARTLK